MNIAKAAEFVTAFNALRDVKAVAVYPINGTPTVVSVTEVTASDVLSGFATDSATKVVAATSEVNVTVSGRQKDYNGTDYDFKDVLDSVQVTDPDNYNKYVDDPTKITVASDAATYQTAAKFKLRSRSTDGVLYLSQVPLARTVILQKATGYVMSSRVVY